MIERRQEHDADALLLLDRFMRIPQNTPGNGWPSTAELQAERIYGLRPVNRIGDLKKGKYNGHCYDFEMIPCGHGVNRWRLHWPNRPGHPKPKNQTVLSLNSPISSFSAGKREETERERPVGDTRHNRAKQFERQFRPGWQSRPFSEKRMAQDDCFVLTPPEPRQ